MIYFIRSGGYVKIGVSVRPWDRLSTLQIGNPEPLEMIAIMPGEYDVEATLHGQFSSDRINGEWFRLSPEIGAAIQPYRVAARRQPVPAPAVAGAPATRAGPGGKARGWRIEFNRRKTASGYIFHWVYRFGSGKDRRTVYGGMVPRWLER